MPTSNVKLAFLLGMQFNVHISLDIIFYNRYNINWNYGLFPQTWEDPTTANSDVEGAFGDNDPGNEFSFCYF
jgi:inorganic pyrophosphatase